MIICAIFLILLMSLMKNRFSFNEHTKDFLLCKRLPSPDYKEVFFLTLSTGYWDYQRFFRSVIFFLFWGLTRNSSRDFLYCLEKKIINSRGKFSTLGKILNSLENSKIQLLRNVSNLEKSHNSWENSQLLRKVSIPEKILNSKGNYQLKRKLLTWKKNIGERKSKKQ